jgi:mRNA interferase RelE/StbE
MFKILIDEDAQEFLSALPKKSQRIIRERLFSLEDDPFPGKGGDKEVIKEEKREKVFRLHISHSYTSFYRVIGNTVYITELMTIEQAHKKYDLL